ncbi:MAG: hypothetical protein WA228_11250, partial [Desulfobaccales bacterium]
DQGPGNGFHISPYFPVIIQSSKFKVQRSRQIKWHRSLACDSLTSPQTGVMARLKRLARTEKFLVQSLRFKALNFEP